MRRFIIAAIMIIFFLGMIFFFWMMFNNILYNPTDGIIEDLDELAEDHMTGEYLDNWKEHKAKDNTSFLFIGVLLMFSLLASLILIAMKNRRENEN